jgi:hypothetical protein
MKIRDIITLIENASVTTIPQPLAWLAVDIQGKRWEAAKRIIVSKTGSIRPGEKFDDDLADTIFLRIQENSQVGRYASEDIINNLGRGAKRLDGPGKITLYRAAPKGGGIRPGDFATDQKSEAGYYKHGGHVIQTAVVPREDCFYVNGRNGDGNEYIYLPRGYEAPTPIVWFNSFADFYRVVNSPE